LEEVNTAINLKASNLAQLPDAIKQKKKEMTVKVQEAKNIRGKLKTILGSAKEDNW